jgi:hypothetical protein
MKNIISHKEIENILSSFKSSGLSVLSLGEKQNVLKSVFDRVDAKKLVVIRQAVKSPVSNYKTYFTQYLAYSIPVVLLALLSTQAAGIFSRGSKLAFDDLNDVKSGIYDMQRNNAIKSNLSDNKRDINEIKSLTLAGNDSVKTQILANQVTNRSQEIRNQVSALVKENNITEAKKVALDLETALKSDDLYTVSTSVQQEVFKAIDLRVDVEKKEVADISSSTPSDVAQRIIDAKKDIADLKSTQKTALATMSISVPATAIVDSTSTVSASTTLDTNIASTTASSSTTTLASATTTDIVKTVIVSSPTLTGKVTSDILSDASKAVDTASKYLKDKDYQNAIISLQLSDRIVAEVKNNLLP